MSYSADAMKALVISGGGSKGQYAVGACRHLLQDLRMDFEVYAGVSVGALIASFLSQYRSGDESRAYEDLAKMFSPIKNGDIWKRWFPFGKLEALWKPSLYNSAPLEALVRRELDAALVRSSGKELRVGAVSLETGKYQVFDQMAMPLAEIVLASASMPFAYKPVRFAGQWWSDGGIKTVTPLKAAIDAGATDIVVIMLSPENPTGEFDPDPNAVEVGLRAINLMSDEIVDKDLKLAQLYNGLVTAGVREDKVAVQLTIIRPARRLNEDSNNFDPAEAQELQYQGYNDAIRVMMG